MWGKAGAAVLIAALSACTVVEGPPPGPPTAGPATVLGTPFLIAFKVPFCAATVAIAAPLAGLTGLAPTLEAREMRRDLDAGVAQNCGPPYALGAY